MIFYPFYIIIYEIRNNRKKWKYHGDIKLYKWYSL
jgi:hypothetical protein